MTQQASRLRVRPAAIIAFAALLASAACTSASRTSGPSASPPSTGRPNIVFVLTDDLSWNLVQYMPHVLAMEKAGTTLSNYYVVDSLCCPSRSAILTGEYPHDDGVFTNGGDDGGYDTVNQHGNVANTYGVALQKAGYRTGFMGKYLNGYEPADKPAQGWDEWDVAGQGYPEFGYQLNENGTEHTYGKSASDYLTDVLSSKAASFIDGAAGNGRPFALEVATFAPHKPSTPAPRDADTFAGLKAPHPKAFDTKPTNAPKWLAAIPPLTAAGEGQIDEQFRKRVQSVQAVDDMVGHLEGELKAKGLGANAYFVFSSDNGYHMGDYQLRPGKQTAFDTDIHLPLMVTGPGVPAGRKITDMTSSIDLAPTFETLAGAVLPKPADGTSLDSLWHGHTASNWRQAVLVEHHGKPTPNDPDKQSKAAGDPPSYEAVRTATALYVRYDDGEREYYDTAADPNELNNLASTPPAALQRALAALSTCHGATACQAAARLR